jgi:putative FmdB family regulatory protein
MPLFEYACPSCHRDFELLIRGSEAPVCPTCGSERVEKLLSVPAAHVEGHSDLPMSAPSPMGGGCGRPQCGQGFCAGQG